MKLFATLILACSFFCSFAADPYYSAKIVKTHYHLDCVYFDVQVWSDNGTPGDPSDDFVVGEGTIKKCDPYVNGIITPSTVITTYQDTQTGCIIFEVTVLDDEGDPFAEGAMAEIGCS